MAISNFVNGIKLSNIYNKLNKCTDADPNETYDIIHSEIELNKNIHLPEKMVKFKKYSHKNSCWITTGILRSITYRDKLYKQLKCTNPDTLLYRNLYVNLNSFNTILKRSIRIAKRMYYESRFGKCKNDIRKTWKLINDILSKTKKQPSQKRFKEGENIINDKAEIAHKFNKKNYKYWAKSCKYDKY